MVVVLQGANRRHIARTSTAFAILALADN